MSRRLPRSFFGIPPSRYDPEYFSRLVESFSFLLGQIQNPGDSRNTTLTLTNLNTSDQGLEPGALFQQNGFVKITLSNTPHVVGVAATSYVGSVTVTTT